ncbi:hypothetical protein [Klebsiella phage DP]|nr:hypothetical protein [Klebsiella phage DP]
MEVGPSFGFPIFQQSYVALSTNAAFEVEEAIADLGAFNTRFHRIGNNLVVTTNFNVPNRDQLAVVNRDYSAQSTDVALAAVTVIFTALFIHQIGAFRERIEVQVVQFIFRYIDRVKRTQRLHDSELSFQSFYEVSVRYGFIFCGHFVLLFVKLF